MKILTFTLILLSSFFGQCQNKNIEADKIEKTISTFFEWHKMGGEFKGNSNYFVPRYSGVSNEITYFDKDSLELFYNNFRETSLFSEQYISQLKSYFDYYGKSIGPKRKPGEIVKIDGLDKDIVLNTFEPEEILNHLNEGKFDLNYIVYNKSLVRFTIRDEIKLIFTLSKIGDKWLIDYIGYDNSEENSFGKQ